MKLMMKHCFWYIPIILVILLNYIFCTYIWFAIEFLELFNNLSSDAKHFIQLFVLGMLGGSIYTSIYFANDYNEVMEIAEKNKRLEKAPAAIDFLGYILFIFGAGITGVVLYLAFKAGIIVMLVGSSEIEINKVATWVIAFSGGFGASQLLVLIVLDIKLVHHLL